MTTLEMRADVLEAAARAAEIDALSAATSFGEALRTTPEFAALIAADQEMRIDEAASAAIAAYSAKQDAYRVEAAMNMLEEEVARELAALLDAMYAVPSVSRYFEAMHTFEALCRETAAVITAEIGIDFAANCRAGGCCGG